MALGSHGRVEAVDELRDYAFNECVASWLLSNKSNRNQIIVLRGLLARPNTLARL